MKIQEHLTIKMVVSRSVEAKVMGYVCGKSGLICCLLSLLMFVRGLVLPLNSNAVLTSFAIISRKKRESVALLYLSRDMRFPTIWYVRSAKPQISLSIREVWPEPLLTA